MKRSRLSQRLQRVTRVREQSGQMLAMLAVSIVALTAAGAFVMDVGSWFRAHRATQSVADASALAGAQELPVQTGLATSVAQLYSTKNGGGVTQITFSTSYLPMDTITVRAQRSAPGFLSKVLGISSVNVGADSVARVYNLGSAKYAAPFGVIKTEPMLNDCGGPCFGSGYPTTLDLAKVGPGSFKIIDIDGSQGGVGPSTLADWISGGLSGTMNIGWYWGDPGVKFNSSQVKDAMDGRVDSDILLPVYDQVEGNGSNFMYEVIGWATFRLTDYKFKGNGGEISGYFVSVAWEGTPTEDTENYFGAKVVKLVG
jgi:Flp pilus assembly protein TadG